MDTARKYLAMTATWPGSWATGKTPAAAKRSLRDIHGPLPRGKVAVYSFPATDSPRVNALGSLTSEHDPQHESGPDIYGVA